MAERQARRIRQWIVLLGGQSRRVEPFLWDPVAGKWIAQEISRARRIGPGSEGIVNTLHLSVCGHGLGEISLALEHRWHRVLLKQRRAQALALIIEEEECAVPSVVQFWDENRPTRAGSELISLKAAQRRARPVREEVVRIQFAVAQEFEETAVQRVGARFGHQRHQSASAAAIFRRVGVGLDPKFLDALNRGNRAD